MKRRFFHPFLPLVLLFAATLFAPSLFATPASRSVSVTGEATVSVEPDRAELAFSVVTRHPDDPDEARRTNERGSAGALNALRALGIPEQSIQQRSLRLQPTREYDSERRVWRETGFEASRQLTVRFDSLELVPRAVAEVVSRGANRIDSLHYDVGDRSAARNEALAAAVAQAREKAGVMAEAAGAELGRVHSIAEDSFQFPRAMMRTEEVSMAADSEPDAYAPGQIEVVARISAVFELR